MDEKRDGNALRYENPPIKHPVQKFGPPGRPKMGVVGP